MRRPQAVGFMDARRIRRRAELQEALNQKAAALPGVTKAAGLNGAKGSEAEGTQANARVAEPGERAAATPQADAEAMDKKEAGKQEAAKRKKKKTG